MRRHPLWIAALAALLLSSAAAAQRPDWQVFVEPQFGTRIDYPADVFAVSGGASERGIGERFRSADGEAVLDVYSLPNTDNVTPAAYLRANLQVPRGQIEYERITAAFFAISNARDGVVYYSRCNFSRGRQALISCFDLQYPQAQERAWDDLVTRMSRSLRPLERG